MIVVNRALHPVFVSLILWCWAAPLLEAQQDPPFFTGLGDLPGGKISSEAYGVSPDGSVVVGRSESTLGPEAFMWTQESGLRGLGDLTGGRFDSIARDVSEDNLTIAGTGTTALGSEAFAWTEETGLRGLGDLAGGRNASFAFGISNDGEFIVGEGTTALGAEAFRKSADSAMTGLGDLPGGRNSSSSRGVSPDGSIVIGSSEALLGTEAFRWTEETRMVGLGDLAGGRFFSEARGISSDGSTIVGHSTSGSGTEAFRWQEDTGMIALGTLPGRNFQSEALAASADGSIVVGFSFPDELRAFLWDEPSQMRDLREELISVYGLNLTGWKLIEATAVSGDGKVIVGRGENPQRIPEGWVANIRLPAPPALSIEMDGNQIVITWSPDSFPTQLQSATDIADPEWEDIRTLRPGSHQEAIDVTLNKYFRIIRP